MILVSNAESHAFVDGNTYPAGTIVWHLVNGELRHVTEVEFRCISFYQPTPPDKLPRLTNAELAARPRYGGEISISGTFTGKAAGG